MQGGIITINVGCFCMVAIHAGEKKHTHMGLSHTFININLSHSLVKAFLPSHFVVRHIFIYMSVVAVFSSSFHLEKIAPPDAGKGEGRQSILFWLFKCLLAAGDNRKCERWSGPFCKELYTCIFKTWDPSREEEKERSNFLYIFMYVRNEVRNSHLVL